MDAPRTTTTPTPPTTTPTPTPERRPKRILAAFLLTPLSVAVLAALGLASMAVVARGSFDLADPLPQALMAFIWSPLLAYPVALLVGAPLYLLLSRFRRITVGSCVVGGAAASLIGSVVVVGIEGGDLVTAAAAGLFAAMAAIGAAYGFVFWLFASWRRAATARTPGRAGERSPEAR